MHRSAPSRQSLNAIELRQVRPDERERYRSLMAQHHYLGDVAKIGESLWYVAYGAGCAEAWVALLSFSAAALKCAARDRWIGWDFRSQYGRLALIANNTRFLILPYWHLPNLGSRVLGLVERRISADWQARYGHPLLLLETFVDPRRFHGGVYRAANWVELGVTRGYRRTQSAAGYSQEAQSDGAKLVFVRPLVGDAQQQLVHATRTELQLKGRSKIMLSSEEMRSLTACFAGIADPRRAQGRIHRIEVVLAIAAGATLCGMQGYKAISQWAKALGQSARERFGCSLRNKERLVPSEFVIRDCLIRIPPDTLGLAMASWQLAWGQRGQRGQQGQQEEALAMDGKTMKGAVDAQGHQTHIMSVVGHESKRCLAQKK
jgi:hypothetical protein